MIITIDGWTKSGKSTIISKICELKPEAIVLHPFDSNEYGKRLRPRWKECEAHEMIRAHTINASIANAFFLEGKLIIVDRSILSMYEYYAHTLQTAVTALPDLDFPKRVYSFYITADWSIPNSLVDSIMRSRCFVIENKRGDLELAARGILKTAGVEL
jgi:thymidylate kinase